MFTYEALQIRFRPDVEAFWVQGAAEHSREAAPVDLGNLSCCESNNFSAGIFLVECQKVVKIPSSSSEDEETLPFLLHREERLRGARLVSDLSRSSAVGTVGGILNDRHAVI